MLHQEFEPPDALRDCVKCFWYTRADFGEMPDKFEVVPDGFAEIIFHFGGSCSITHNGKLLPLLSPFIMGLLNQPFVFYAKNRLEVVGIRCYPWTVFDLLGIPPAKHTLHVLDHPVARLQPALESLMQSGKLSDAFARIRQFFLDARSQVSIDSTLYKAGVAMNAANGRIPVSEVAVAAHASVRSLERKFKQSSGHTVKDVSALMRFEQARNRLWESPNTNIAGLAYELGYTDQSHLSREFKRFSGTTPAAFARKSKKGHQGLNEDFVAFVQS